MPFSAACRFLHSSRREYQFPAVCVRQPAYVSIYPGRSGWIGSRVEKAERWMSAVAFSRSILMWMGRWVCISVSIRMERNLSGNVGGKKCILLSIASGKTVLKGIYLNVNPLLEWHTLNLIFLVLFNIYFCFKAPHM
jgi:hypothetical protein